MNIVDAAILGIVEGLTEFLPISSTAHLILASRILGLLETDFLKTFEIAIQLGAILAVLAVYGKTLIVKKEIIQPIILAFIPTAVIGFMFYPFIKNNLLGNIAVVASALGIGGIILIILEFFWKRKKSEEKKKETIRPKEALIIGVFQSLAIIPGVSRAAATIVGGLFLGIERKTIVEFSFLLAIPTIGAATGLDLLKNFGSISSSELPLLLTGFVFAFITALLAIRSFLTFIKHQNFIGFGVYRLLLAGLIFLFLVK